MADFKLQIIISAVDRASKELKQISGAIDKNAASITSLGRNMAIAGAAITGALGFTIKAASDLEETQAKFTTVFGEQIDQAKEWGKTLQDSYLLSEEASLRYLASVQDLLVPMGVIPKKAAELSNEVVKLSADLGSFNNLPTEQVMLSIQSALTGEFQSMKKFGIILNQTRIEQEAMNMGLITNKSQLTAATKAQAVMNLMMKDSKAAIGDVARTSDGFANTLKDLQAKFKDLQTEIGNKLLPIITDFATKARDTIKEVTKWAQENEELTKQFVILTAKAGAFLFILGGILLVLPQIVTAMTLLAAHPFVAIAIAVAGVSIATFEYLDALQDVNNANIELGNTIQSLIAIHMAEIEVLRKKAAGMRFDFEEQQKIAEEMRRIFKAIKDLRIKQNDEIRKKEKKTGDEVIDIVSAMEKAWNDYMEKRMSLSLSVADMYLNMEKSIAAGFKSGIGIMLTDIRDFDKGVLAITDSIRNSFISAAADMATEWLRKIGVMKAAMLAFKAISAFATGGLSTIFGFQDGTPFVPQTGLAMIHKGEAVIPADQNPFVHGGAVGAGGGGGGLTIQINGQFLEADETRWVDLVRDFIVPALGVTADKTGGIA